MNPVPMAFAALALGVCASVPSAQQPQGGIPRLLSEPLPLGPREDVKAFGFSPDGSQLACLVGKAFDRSSDRLYLARADGAGAPVVLAHVDPWKIPLTFRFLADGEHLLYSHGILSDSYGSERVFTVPLDGSSPPFDPVPPFDLFASVLDYALTPDETRIVYTTHLFTVPFTGFKTALFSRPLAGGPSLRLSPEDWSISSDFVVSPDGRFVVYHSFVGGDSELYAAAVDVAGSSVLISPPVRYRDPLAVTADSRHVVFFASSHLYSSPIDGSAPPLLLSAAAPSLLLLTHDSARAIVLAQGILSSVPLDGSSPASLSPAGVVKDVRMTGDGGRVVFRLDRDAPGKFELFSAPTDGATPAIRLSPDMPETGDVLQFALSPDGARIAWRADATTDGHFDLYGAPTDGSAPATLLATPARADEDVDGRLVLGSGGTQVVFFTGVPGGELALFRVPTDGSAAPVRLDDHLVLPAEGPELVATPDGARFVYRRVLARGQELCSVAFTGNAPPVTHVAAMHLDQQTFSPDGASLAFVADAAEIDTAQELYVGPLDGSTDATQVSQEFMPTEVVGNVHGFRVAGERALYLSDRDASGTTGLFSVPLRGPVRLRISGDVDVINPVERDAVGNLVKPNGFELADGGARAVFRGMFGGRKYLLSTPVDRLADPFVLDAGSQPLSRVVSYTITPRGRRALFLADLDESGVFQLYRAPVAFQGFPHRVNGPLVSGGDVLSGFRITPDERRVLYVADQDVDGVFELYSVDRSGATRRLTSVGPTEDVQTDLELSPDGTRVFFRTWRTISPWERLFSAPCDGSAPPVELSVSSLGIKRVLPGFQVTADGAHVLFAGQLPDGQYKLFRADSAGGTPAFPLSASLPVDVRQVLVTPGDTHAVFLGYGYPNSGNVLFAVPMGGGRAVRLSVASPGYVRDFQITPDGTRVLYRFHSDESRHTSLAIVPIDRSSPTLRLDPGTHDVDTFRLDPSATSVVFRTQNEGVQDPGVLNRVPLDGSLPAVELTSVADDVGPDFDFANDGSLLYRAQPFPSQSYDEHRSLFAFLTEAPPFEAPAPAPSVTAPRTH